MQAWRLYLTKWKIIGLISHMETRNEHHGGSDDFVDPLSHLALLNRSTRAPEYEAFLNFGPWWYCPLWATFTGFFTLWARARDQDASGTTSTAFLLVSLVAASVLSAHWFKREVQPRVTPLSVLLSGLACAIVWSVGIVWSVAVNIIGYQDFLVPWVPIGWISSTAFFFILRAVLLRLRARTKVAAI